MKLNRLLLVIPILVTAIGAAGWWLVHSEAVYQSRLQNIYSVGADIDAVILIVKLRHLQDPLTDSMLVDTLGSLEENINALMTSGGTGKYTVSDQTLTRFEEFESVWHSAIYPRLQWLARDSIRRFSPAEQTHLLNILRENRSDIEQIGAMISAHRSFTSILIIGIGLLSIILSFALVLLLYRSPKIIKRVETVQDDSHEKLRTAKPAHNGAGSADISTNTIIDYQSDNTAREQLALEALTQLVKQPESTKPFVLLLNDIEKLSGALSSAIFVATDPSSELSLWTSTDPDDTGWQTIVVDNKLPNTGMTESDTNMMESIEMPGEVPVKYYFTRLCHASDDFSILVLKCPANHSLPDSLNNIFSDHIERLTNIVSSVRFARLKLRHAQYEERAVIARELHDSLAQSLSYLKIQTSRLQKILTASEMQEHSNSIEIDAIMQDIRINLNIAYRHLRELISTFRLTMGGKDFSQALMDSVGEFAKRSSIAFDIDNRLPSGVLTVSEETQLLHIIRESLSNIVRHSRARLALISIHYNHGQVKASIEDDGVGLINISDQEQHFGIILMQERAHSIGGSINLSERSGGGTCLIVRFHTEKHADIDTSEVVQKQGNIA